MVKILYLALLVGLPLPVFSQNCFSPLAEINSKPPLPTGALKVEEGEHYIVYKLPGGITRVMFRADQAFMINPMGWGRPRASLSHEATNETGAVVLRGKVIVVEGFHRAVAVAHGAEIPREAGEIKKGWLDYEVRRGYQAEPDTKLIDAPWSNSRNPP